MNSLIESKEDLNHIVDPTSLDELIKMRDDYKKQVQKRGEELLVKSFKKFFEENPNIESIRWEQYTPHFNDGEPCVFSVNSPYYRTFEMAKCFNEDNELLDEYSDSDDNFGDYNDGYDSMRYFYSDNKRNKVDEEQEKRLRNCANIIEESEDILQMIFGDGVQVVVDREGITSSEYQHD